MTKTKLTKEPKTGLWNTPIDRTRNPLEGLKVPKNFKYKYKMSKAMKKRLEAFSTRPTHIDTRLIY